MPHPLPPAHRRRGPRSSAAIGALLGALLLTPPAVASQPAGPTAPSGEIAAAAASKRAALRLTVVGKRTRTVAPRRWSTVKVAIANRGRAPLRKVRLVARPSRGITAQLVGAPRTAPRTKVIASIRAGKRALATLRVRANGRGKVALAASAPGQKRSAATVSLRLQGRRANRPVATGALAGRSFWGFKSRLDYAWDNYGIWFLDDRWAYWGFPPAGKPSCTRETTVRDRDGKLTEEGCRRYSHNTRTGAVTVGRLRGTFQRGTLKVDGISMYPLALPRAGTRFAVELVNTGYRGFCGLITGCTTWTTNLLLSRDGKFVWSRQSISSMGGAGTPYVWGANFPPDETGTYEVLADGRIRFRYLDGTVRAATIGVELDRAGRPSPAGEGIVIEGTNFYPKSD